MPEPPHRPGSITGRHDPIHTMRTREDMRAARRAFDDDRREKTPVPEAKKFRGSDEEFKALVAAYVVRKDEEAAAGYSLPDVYSAVNELSEELKALRTWQEDHMRLYHPGGLARLPKPGAQPVIVEADMAAIVTPPAASIPPMRQVADTGSFRYNDAELTRAKAALDKQFAEARAENQRALEDLRSQQKVAGLEALAARVEWWKEHTIEWVLGGIGVGIIVALVIWALTGHRG